MSDGLKMVPAKKPIDAVSDILRVNGYSFEGIMQVSGTVLRQYKAPSGDLVGIMPIKTMDSEGVAVITKPNKLAQLGQTGGAALPDFSVVQFKDSASFRQQFVQMAITNGMVLPNEQTVSMKRQKVGTI